MVQHSVVQHSVVQRSVVQRSMGQHSVVQHSVVQRSMGQPEAQRMPELLVFAVGQVKAVSGIQQDPRE